MPRKPKEPEVTTDAIVLDSTPPLVVPTLPNLLQAALTEAAKLADAGQREYVAAKLKKAIARLS